MPDDANESDAEASSSDSGDAPLPGEIDDDDDSEEMLDADSEPDSTVSSGDVHSMHPSASREDTDLEGRLLLPYV